MVFETNLEEIIFHSGDPIVDYYEYIIYRSNCVDIEYVSNSSSVDHFISDCNYSWRYLNQENNKFITNEEIDKWIFDRNFDMFNKYLSLICSNRIKTKKGYNNHIRKFYKNNPDKKITIIKKLK